MCDYLIYNPYTCIYTKVIFMMTLDMFFVIDPEKKVYITVTFSTLIASQEG